jgi:hypothetical protein
MGITIQRSSVEKKRGIVILTFNLFLSKRPLPLSLLMQLGTCWGGKLEGLVFSGQEEGVL